MKYVFLFFFLTIASASLIPCSSQTKNEPNDAKPLQKEIYLQLYSLRDDAKKDLTNTIKKVSEMGFTGIEAANYNDGKIYDMEPEAFLAFMKENNLTLLSAHIKKEFSDDMTAANWDEIWNWWDVAIAAHKAAGAKYVVWPHMASPKTLKALKQYCDYFNQIGERCNKAGLRFGYHNHDFEFKKVENQVIYDYMLQNTDPSKVFFEMDVYWVNHSGNKPVDYFKKYPGRFPLLHIKDEKEMGESGDIDFEVIFNNAEVAGLKHVILEQENYSFAPIESVQKSLDFLMKSPFVKANYNK